MHPSHTSPDPANDRADQTLRMARVVRERLAYGQAATDIHDDLVPNYVSEDDFFLALAAALVLSK
jgi:hypothetical protein